MTPPTTLAVAVKPTDGVIRNARQGEGRAGGAGKRDCVLKVTVRLVTRDRWAVPSLTTVATPALGTRRRRYRCSRRSVRKKPREPRSSPVRPAGLEPALMSGLVVCSAMVCLGPPLLDRPAAAKKRVGAGQRGCRPRR